MTGYTANLTNQAPHDASALKRWREAVAIRGLRIQTENNLSGFDEKEADLLPNSNQVQIQDRYIYGTDKLPGHSLSGYLQRGEFNTLQMLQAELKHNDDTMELFVERQGAQTTTTVRKIAGSAQQGQWTLQEDSAKGTLFMEFTPPSLE